jgi:hypothetical protein
MTCSPPPTPPIAQHVANLTIAERIRQIPTNRHHDDFVLKPPTEEQRIARRAWRRHTARVQGRRGLPGVCNRTVSAGPPNVAPGVDGFYAFPDPWLSGDIWRIIMDR